MPVKEKELKYLLLYNIKFNVHKYRILLPE